MEDTPKKKVYKRVVKVIKKNVNESELDKKRKYYQKRVDYAITRGKVYRVIGSIGIGNVRIELHKRGFIETMTSTFQNELYKLPDDELLQKAEANNQYEQALLTKMLGDQEPDFLWINRTSSFLIYNYVPIMNKVNIFRANFVLKDGLCECIQMWKKNQLQKLAEINHPRSYMVSSENYYENFLNDYKFTIVTSIILYLSAKKDLELYFTENGTLSLEKLNVALQIIKTRFGCEEDNPRFIVQNDETWKDLAEVLNKLVNGSETFHFIKTEKKEDPNTETSDKINDIQNNPNFNPEVNLIKNDSNESELDQYLTDIKQTACFILKQWPWRKHDGYHNIWLLKPARTGEGAGIKLTGNAEEIKEHIKKHRYKPFVIQKYIERPLLVYGTKHDIRQYYLITIDNNYLRAWSHATACTIKFASETFNLTDLTEERHITNTAVQMKYSQVSHPHLPKHHMYTLGAYILYLNSIDKGHLWTEYVYPKMKKTLQAVTMASLENIEMRPGRFELFGCDWILGIDFKPYLLEINRCPSLEYYSPVSEIVCGTVTDDLVKVTVDYLKHKSAPTGDFELIYEYRIPEVNYNGDNDECLM